MPMGGDGKQPTELEWTIYVEWVQEGEEQIGLG